MPVTSNPSAFSVAIGLAAALTLSHPAAAKEVCGWYAVAFCSAKEADATEFVNKGWGQLVDTRKYKGLEPNQHCVVSGPQPEDSAARDSKAAVANGAAKAVDVKQACTDEANLGD